MKKAFKDFLRELLFDRKEPDRVSKTKAGVWLGLVFFILYTYGTIDQNTYNALLAVAGGILGVGVKDLIKK